MTWNKFYWTTLWFYYTCWFYSLVELHANTPPLGAHATATLEALDPTTPNISQQNLQRSNPRTHETFTFEDDQNVSDV